MATIRRRPSSENTTSRDTPPQYSISKLGLQALQPPSPQPCLKHCICSCDLQTTNKFCLVLWGLLICLHFLSWRLCSSPGPSLAQMAKAGWEKSGRLQIQRALISSLHIPHIARRFTAKPYRRVLGKVWVSWGLLFVLFLFFCKSAIAISSVLELNNSRGKEFTAVQKRWFCRNWGSSMKDHSKSHKRTGKWGCLG